MKVRVGRVYMGGWAAFLLAPMWFMAVAAFWTLVGPFWLIAKLFKRRPHVHARAVGQTLIRPLPPRPDKENH